MYFPPHSFANCFKGIDTHKVMGIAFHDLNGSYRMILHQRLNRRRAAGIQGSQRTNDFGILEELLKSARTELVADDLQATFRSALANASISATQMLSGRTCPLCISGIVRSSSSCCWA